MQLTLERRKQIAILTVVVGILIWRPTLVNIPSPLWLLSFPLGFFGAYFAYQVRVTLLLILNVVLFFSYFILMTLFSFVQNY